MGDKLNFFYQDGDNFFECDEVEIQRDDAGVSTFSVPAGSHGFGSYIEIDSDDKCWAYTQTEIIDVRRHPSMEMVVDVVWKNYRQEDCGCEKCSAAERGLGHKQATGTLTVTSIDKNAGTIKVSSAPDTDEKYFDDLLAKVAKMQAERVAGVAAMDAMQHAAATQTQSPQEYGAVAVRYAGTVSPKSSVNTTTVVLAYPQVAWRFSVGDVIALGGRITLHPGRATVVAVDHVAGTLTLDQVLSVAIPSARPADDIYIVGRTEQKPAGMNCAGPCGEYNQYAEPNQPDGKYVCYTCRQRV